MALQENLGKDTIERIVLDAVQTLNLGRDADHQLEVSPTAPLYSKNERWTRGFGLVALLIEIEEALRDVGCNVSLAMNTNVASP